MKGKGKGKDKGKEKGKRKSQGSSEETTRPAPAPTGIDDETAQNVAEFEDLVARGDEALHAELNSVSGPTDSVPMADPSSIPAPPPLPPPMQPRIQGPVTVSINNAQHPSTNNAEERDLDRISAMVDDLQTRIERLRVVYASRRQQSEQSDAGEVDSAQRSAERSEIVDGNGDGGALAAVQAEEMD